MKLDFTGVLLHEDAAKCRSKLQLVGFCCNLPSCRLIRPVLSLKSVYWMQSLRIVADHDGGGNLEFAGKDLSPTLYIFMTK